MIKIYIYPVIFGALISNNASAFNYDFIVGKIDLPNDYSIITKSKNNKIPFNIIASKNIKNPEGKIIVTTMVYDYTNRHNNLLTEDNAEEYLLKYIKDLLLAQEKSLRIIKKSKIRKATINNKLGLNTLFFGKLPTNIDYTGITTVTYTGKYIVAFVVIQAGVIEVKNITYILNKLENYTPN